MGTLPRHNGPTWLELTLLGTPRPLQDTSHKSSSNTYHTASQCKLTLRGLNTFLESLGQYGKGLGWRQALRLLEPLTGPLTVTAGPGAKAKSTEGLFTVSEPKVRLRSWDQGFVPGVRVGRSSQGRHSEQAACSIVGVPWQVTVK